MIFALNQVCNFDFGDLQNNEKPQILQDFSTILESLDGRSYELVQLPDWIYFNFKQSGRKLLECTIHLILIVGINRLELQVQKIIELRRKENVSHPDLLDSVMNYKKEDGITPFFSDKEIIHEILTFLVIHQKMILTESLRDTKPQQQELLGLFIFYHNTLWYKTKREKKLSIFSTNFLTQQQKITLKIYHSQQIVFMKEFACFLHNLRL